MVATAVDTKGLAAAVRTAFRSRGIPRSPPPVIKVETTKDHAIVIGRHTIWSSTNDRLEETPKRLRSTSGNVKAQI